MSAQFKETVKSGGIAEVCAVAVIYENLPARDLAIELSDALMRKFQSDLEFGFTWWRFDYLADPNVGKEAAEAAMSADLIVVALQNTGNISWEVQGWFEHWLVRRSSPGGALTVIHAPVEPGSLERIDDSFFRRMAAEAGLEYLPPPGSESPNNSTDHLREDQSFSPDAGFFQFPDHEFHSSGWGLNE